MYTVQVRGWVWACSNLSKTMRDLLFRTSNSTHKLVNYITSIQNNGKKTLHKSIYCLLTLAVSYKYMMFKTSDTITNVSCHIAVFIDRLHIYHWELITVYGNHKCIMRLCRYLSNMVSVELTVTRVTFPWCRHISWYLQCVWIPDPSHIPAYSNLQSVDWK